MNDVRELKHFAQTHARAQRIAHCERILAGISTDEDGRPGSWSTEWTRHGDALRERGRPLAALRHYNMARFPYVDGPARALAHRRSLESFAGWAAGRSLERLEVALPGGRVACWASGLSAERPRPLVLLCGGIVSGKEQWAPALGALDRFGMAGVVLELPGVGENPLRFDGDSWQLLPRIIDAVADRAEVDTVYTVTLSFSGQLALRAAAEDKRIRGVVTAGAPVKAFFTDADWLARLPRITADTLAHLTGARVDELPELLAPWALEPALIADLDIPIAYSASRRDEIIPAADVRLLRDHARRLRLVEHDDVHGAPRHVAETRLWALLSVLRMHGVRGPRTAALGAVLRLLSARGQNRSHDSHGPR
ncbi:esterase FrsA [Kitasatospora sp. GAS204A]|uniref:alpha/beta fold hydrolase n=1 Tax=unclassified Kitasatospora TaxID=2633591 RepID=UPI002476B18E|nr:alpha/beta fold hydrolase [Kitasatospora sp. GAS204B]MDH6118811.1 esterase FrsA [Kitasatospora sp. GAS204B]